MQEELYYKLTPEEKDKILESLGIKGTHEDLTLKDVRKDKISCWDWINISWTYDIVEMALQEKPIKLEYLGGIHEEDTIAYKTKLLEDVYEEMNEQTTFCCFKTGKNILYASVLAFKKLTSYTVAIMVIEWFLNIWRIQKIKTITNFIEEKDRMDPYEGIWEMS